MTRSGGCAAVKQKTTFCHLLKGRFALHKRLAGLSNPSPEQKLPTQQLAICAGCLSTLLQHFFWYTQMIAIEEKLSWRVPLSAPLSGVICNTLNITGNDFFSLCGCRMIRSAHVSYWSVVKRGAICHFTRQNDTFRCFFSFILTLLRMLCDSYQLLEHLGLSCGKFLMTKLP